MPSMTGSGLGAILALSMAVSSWPASAQQQPMERFEEELIVTEVVLDVLVTDARDRVVVGLGPADFTVEEDGQPVSLQSVVFYSSRTLLDPSTRVEHRGGSIDRVPENRYYIFLFQSQRRSSGEIPGILGSQMDAARQCGRWIEQGMLPSDWAAIAVYDTRLDVLQDFTRDPRALQAALERAARGSLGDRDWPSRRPASGTEPSLLRSLPAGRELARQTKDIYQGLRVLAQAAGATRGRKILLLFGRGIGEIGIGGFWEPDPRFYRPTVETLNDNNVAVYPLDLSPAGTRHSLERSFEALASDTGGEFQRLFTSFLTPLERISAANSGYYLLSYQSRKPATGSGFQRVTVLARNPELRVKARQGYLYGE